MRRISTHHIALYSLLFLIVILLLAAFFTYNLNSKKTRLFVESTERQLEHSVHQVLALDAQGIKQGVNDYTYWDDFVTGIARKDTAWARENINEMIKTFRVEAAWVFDSSGREVYSAAVPSFLWLREVRIPSSFLDSLNAKKSHEAIIGTQDGYVTLIGATVHPSNDPLRKSNPQGFYIIGRYLGTPFLNNLSRILASKVELTTDVKPAGMIRNNEAIAIMVPMETVDRTSPLYLYVEKKIPFLKQYTQFSVELLLLLFCAAVVILFGAWLTFSRWVSRPLKLVGELLATNDINADEKLSGFGYEFQDIGALIRCSVEQKKQLGFLRKKAEESDRLKSSFLANMSHEIRTPLNGILGFSELMYRRAINDEPSANYMRVIKKCSDDLLQIINDLLDISKLEADQMTMHFENISCKELLGELQLQYNQGNSYIRENLELVFKTDDCSSTVLADRLRLKQILTNLLNNAIKFTEKGSIEIGCMPEEDGFLVFYVKDSGIGIPESQQELIFERFRQSESNFTISRQYGGVGLGLSISKGLVDKMGGAISLRSVAGTGTTFFVRIPLAVGAK